MRFHFYTYFEFHDDSGYREVRYLCENNVIGNYIGESS